MITYIEIYKPTGVNIFYKVGDEGVEKIWIKDEKVFVSTDSEVLEFSGVKYVATKPRKVK